MSRWLLLSFLVGAVALAQNPEPPTENLKCRIETSMGTIDVELFVDEAPATVANFVDLAEGRREYTLPDSDEPSSAPFFDGLLFHRVIEGFMIQGGCPLGNGGGGPGYSFEDEINADALGLDTLAVVLPDGQPHPWLGIQTNQDLQRILVWPLTQVMGIEDEEQFNERLPEIQDRLNKLTIKEAYENMGYQYSDTLTSRPPLRGVLAMANSGPNTNGSQFFINLVDTPWLTGKHTVFGQVIAGMDVVDAIGGVSVGMGARPVEEVRIVGIRLLDE